MKKLRKIKALKLEAWKTFSEWTRRKWADKNGIVQCISCPAKIHWKEANASHWKHGHSKKSFFMEENVNPSCVKCNLYMSGNLSEYTLWILNRYEENTVNAIRQASREIYKPSRQELENFIIAYKTKLELLNEKF